MQPPQSYPIKDLYTVFATSETGFLPQVQPVTVGTLLSFRIGTIFETRGSLIQSDQEPLLAPIGCRVVQMGPIQRKGAVLSDPQRFLLAEAINAALFFCSQSIVMFKKRNHPMSTCSFVVDRRSLHCFILLDELAHGAEKKIRCAAALPFSLSKDSFLAVAKTNRKWRDRGVVNVPISQELCTLFTRELFARKDNPAFPEMYAVLGYRSGGLPSIAKVVCIEEKMEAASELLLSDLRPDDQIKFVRQFFHHLAQMRPRIHGDVKTTNVLYKMTEKGIDARLIDLSFSCYPEHDLLHSPMQQGWYGSVFCTAPEVIGKDPRGVDWYKAESWAAGCALYSWLTKELVSWGWDLCDAYDLGRTPEKDSIRVKVRMVRESLEKKAQEPSSEGIIAKLCLDLLEWDPQKRLDMSGAEERFSRYL